MPGYFTTPAGRILKYLLCVYTHAKVCNFPRCNSTQLTILGLINTISHHSANRPLVNLTHNNSLERFQDRPYLLDSYLALRL
jgi:hypothetical protein